MPARTNKRILYANQQVGLKADGDTGAYTALYGVQSVGINTNFNLVQYFELGQLEIYENLEDLPDVEVTLSKLFDGRPLIWHEATIGATAGPSLVNRSNEKCIFGMGIFPDTNDSATGTPPSIVECSGLFPSSLSYEFTTDGGFTENVTLVGNDKIWKNDTKLVNATDIARAAALTFAGVFTTNADSPVLLERKEYLIFDYDAGDGLDANNMSADPDATILPPEVDGISASGTNEKSDGQNYDAHVQSISISTDLGREQIDELGRRGPYHRFANFPVQVTCAIQVISTSGDMVSATENGILNTGGACAIGANLSDRTIRIATCGGARIYLGTKNKLESVDYGGADAGGGNATSTYNFTTFNNLTVMAEYDPNPANTGGGGWWANRENYLVTL